MVKKEKKDKERGIETKILKAEAKREIETGRQRKRNIPERQKKKKRKKKKNKEPF